MAARRRRDSMVPSTRILRTRASKVTLGCRMAKARLKAIKATVVSHMVKGRLMVVKVMVVSSMIKVRHTEAAKEASSTAAHRLVNTRLIRQISSMHLHRIKAVTGSKVARVNIQLLQVRATDSALSNTGTARTANSKATAVKALMVEGPRNQVGNGQTRA